MLNPQSLKISFCLMLAASLCLTGGRAIKASESAGKNPFAEQKVHIDLRNLSFQNGIQVADTFSKAAPATETLIPEGSELIALVDSDCFRRGRAGTLSRYAVGGELAVLDLQAYKWTLRDSQTLEQLSAAADVDPCIVGVTENIKFEVNGTYTNDTYSSQQVHMPSIDADEGYEFFWASKFKITQDVIIAVVDTGVDYLHPDLAGQMWKNSQGQYGYDFVNSTSGTPDTNPMDDNGHGTHVAGLAGATSSNQVGVSGVFGFHGKIMAVKVMDAAGEGDLATVVNGIRYAVSNGAHVINLSIGGQGQNLAVKQALVDAVAAGVTVVMAAGNNSTQLSNTSYFSPGSYGSGIDGALTVGAYDTVSMDRPAFSNYSTTFVEIGAPGSSGSKGLASTYTDPKYAYLSGTSMASPIAAGAAALVIGFLKTKNLPVNPAAIEDALKGGAIKSTRLANDFSDGNQLNLLEITKYLQNSYVFDGSSALESQ